MIVSSKVPFPVGMQHVAVEVTHMERSIAFYRKVLGMKLTEHHKAFEIKEIPVELCFLRLEASQNHHDIVLTHNPNKKYESKETSSAPNFHHMAFKLENESSWKGFLSYIHNCKVEVVRGPVLHSPFQEGGEGSWGENKSFYVLDPDGHRIEFFCDMASIDSKGFYRDEKNSLIDEKAKVSEL